MIFAILLLLGNELSLIEWLQSCKIGLAKISVPAALDGFKPFNVFNIFSGDVSEDSKFKSFY